jgi:hypothetical protein
MTVVIISHLFLHGVCCFWVLRLPRNPALTNHAADLLSPVFVLWIRTFVFVNHIIIPTLENKIRARGWRFDVEKNQQTTNGDPRKMKKKKEKRQKEETEALNSEKKKKKKKKKKRNFSGSRKEKKKEKKKSTDRQSIDL